MASSAAVLSVSPFRLEPLPLCAHCGLAVAGRAAPGEPLYCCGGCALAHRITGGASGHGRAAGMLMSIGIGAFLAMNVMMLSFVLYSGRGEADRSAGEAWVRWALLVLATPAMALLGGPFLLRGLERLRTWRLDTDALIVLGVVAAYVLSFHSVASGRGPLFLDTAMGILLFVTVGRYLEAAARARTTDALQALARQLPDEATRERDGRSERVPTSALEPGDLVRVRPGERVPVDGVIRAGEASVSEAELTGESLPVVRREGDAIAAGTLDLDGSLLISALRTGPQTTLARMVRLVEAARAAGYPLAPLVDRISALFVPLVLALALATFGGWWLARDLGTGILNALSVLLIACPCAIGIATPLAAAAATGRAAAAGVLVRSGEVFERLARSRRVFFDKTGTLTRGELEVVALAPTSGLSASELLRIAASLEAPSEHPIGSALRQEAQRRGIPLAEATAFRAWPGRGVTGRLDGVEGELRLGSAAFTGGTTDAGPPGATLVSVACDGRSLGTIALRDSPRPEAASAIAALAARGLRLELLSGDRCEAVAAFVAQVPGLLPRAEMSPEDKQAEVARALARGEAPVMVGDGINDALALSRAAVGVTLESGTDLARESADVTILGGDLGRLPWLFDLATRTLRTARLNLFWAFFYNSIGLALAVSGRLHPFFGAFAMVASSLLVVLHSQRLARVPLAGTLA